MILLCIPQASTFPTPTPSLLVSTPTINNHHFSRIGSPKTPLIGANVMAATAYDESGSVLLGGHLVASIVSMQYQRLEAICTLEEIQIDG